MVVEKPKLVCYGAVKGKHERRCGQNWGDGKACREEKHLQEHALEVAEAQDHRQLNPEPDGH